MRSLQDEIRQAQQELTCPICSRSFELRDIHLRTFMNDKSAELSVTCNRSHFPIILIVPVNLKEVAKAGPIEIEELRAINGEIERLGPTFEDIFVKH